MVVKSPPVAPPPGEQFNRPELFPGCPNQPLPGRAVVGLIGPEWTPTVSSSSGILPVIVDWSDPTRHSRTGADQTPMTMVGWVTPEKVWTLCRPVANDRIVPDMSDWCEMTQTGDYNHTTVNVRCRRLFSTQPTGPQHLLPPPASNTPRAPTESVSISTISSPRSAAIPVQTYETTPDEFRIMECRASVLTTPTEQCSHQFQPNRVATSNAETVRICRLLERSRDA